MKTYEQWGKDDLVHADGPIGFKLREMFTDWTADRKQQFLVLRELRDSLVGISDMCARDRNYGIEAYARAACARADKALEQEEK